MHTHGILLNAYTCDSVERIHVRLCKIHVCDPLMHTCVILLNAYMCDSVKYIHVLQLNACMCDSVKYICGITHMYLTESHMYLTESHMYAFNRITHACI